ncbi:polynucleotide adenylyltransferase PcnB [Kingella kingae]|uniref:polynucleotide adenylyltransferase PcnB n=1 Tax=Kingella kingae TaxID=504 RepID=UPI00254DE157|nr:polynucleotide adenylyltransferase PcnB [Kingella kingae]MDK4530254.1 polynucleotide adenylyltransferase PcnB [Kingella kingae]MDK4611581.1 polynucleotide adenylyltransferase PcnB [Kingella kingae]
MLKKWLDNMLPKRRKRRADAVARHHLVLPVHHAAEKVLRDLHQAGFEAYLVGGAVRDLLLGVEPKDFDVATNATPEQVYRLFKRSRVIGRRFPIVHVMIGRDTIEVSTFRSGGKVKQNADGRIMQDVAYGTVEQDAHRRDFTCNALYYDIFRQEVLDFHQGVNDIQVRRLVMIGDPKARYMEDPVRILRAIRLAGKLGFEVEANTAAPLAECVVLLRKEPVSRLFDELMKILFSGNASGCLQQFHVLGIQNIPIHPMLTAMLHASQAGSLHMCVPALQQTDERLRNGQSVSVGFILAALFWDELNTYWQKELAHGKGSAAAMMAAVNQLRDEMEHGWGVPQRFSATMREIWLLQPHFENRRGGRPFRLLAQVRFRAAYDFLLLRAQSQSSLHELADWWTRFQRAGKDERQEMANTAPDNTAGSSKKRKRKPRKKKPKTAE